MIDQVQTSPESGPRLSSAEARSRSAARLFTGSRLLLAVIIFLGGFLRLWSVETAQYQYDDEMTASRARAIVQGAQFTSAVPASIASVTHGPVAPYVAAIPTVISDSYELLVAFNGILNTAALLLFYVVARALFGTRGGLMATALMAFNPWLVATGRRGWLNAQVAPAAVLLLWAAHWAFTRRSARAWAAAGAALSLSAQIHLGSLANIPAAAVGALPAIRRSGIGKAWIGVLVALLVALPWLAIHFFSETQRYNPSISPRTPDAWAAAVDRALLLVANLGYQSVVLQGSRVIDATAQPFAALDVLDKGLAGTAWFWLLWRGARDWKSSHVQSGMCLLAALTVALPIILAAILASMGGIIYPHWWYFFNGLPALLLAMAGLLEHLSRRVRLLGPALCAAVAVPQLVLAIPYFATQDEFWVRGFYGVPWNHVAEFDDHLRSLAASSGDTFTLVAGVFNENWTQGEMIATVVGHRTPRVRQLDGHDGLVFRTDASTLLYVSTDDEHVMTRFLVNELGAPEVYSQRLPGEGWMRRIFETRSSEIEKWAGGRLNAQPQGHPTGAIANYERASLLRPDDRFPSYRLATLWQFERELPEPILAEFVFRSDGREVHREEHVAYPAAFWQQGDWLSTRVLNLFELPATFQPGPDLTVTVRNVGIYTQETRGPLVELTL